MRPSFTGRVRIPWASASNFSAKTADAEVIGVARTANYQAIGEKARPFRLPFHAAVLLPDSGSVDSHRRGAGCGAGIGAQRGAGPRPQPAAAGRNGEHHHPPIAMGATPLGRVAGGFRMLALLLSTIGIYGVVSYLVAHRVREFGIRMALGATAADVQLMLLREGVRLVAGSA
jgi:hypothetical protein